jgi:glyoxylase-like metal-dependent hydrolase (beta-lactamase superfamily II)
MTAAGDLRLHRVAPDVFVYRGYFSNSVVLRCRRGLVIVDTQVSLRAAARLKDSLQGLGRSPHSPQSAAALSDLPILAVVNTHYHGDHTGGNAAFGGIPIFGTSLCASFVVERDAERVQYANTFGLPFSEIPPAIPPDRTFTGSEVLAFGDDVFELMQIGRAETPDACVVHWHNRGVIACGDGVATCEYPFLGVPFRDEGLRADGEWLRFLGTIERLAPSVLVPGHGPAMVGKRPIRARLRLLATLMNDLVEVTKEEMNRGGSVAEIVARADARLRRYARRADLEQRTVSQQFAILRCVNNLSPERAGRGWWADLRPSVLKQGSGEEGRALLATVLNHSGRTGRVARDPFAEVRRAAIALARRDRPQALALVAAYRDGGPRDSEAQARGLMSDLLFDGARSVRPLVDATEYVAAALHEARAALRIDPDEPLALLTLGCAEVFGGMVLAQPMAAAEEKLVRALGAGELSGAQRRRGEFFLGKARQMEGDAAGADRHFRRVLPAWARLLYPLLRRQMRNYP